MIVCDCLFGVVLGLPCCSGFSLVAASRGYSHYAVQASHCGDFSRCRGWDLGPMGSAVAASTL